MNEKKAKKLRAIAKMLLVNVQKDNPSASIETRYMENTARRKKHVSYKIDEHGEVILSQDGKPTIENVFDVSTGTITLAKDCLRGIYKTLKSKNV